MALKRGQRQVQTTKNRMGVVPITDTTAIESLVNQLGPTIERGIINTANIQDETYRSNFNIESMKFFGDLAIKFANNPDGYYKASESYINEAVAKTPNHLQQYVKQSAESTSYPLGFKIQQNFITKQKTDMSETLQTELGQFTNTINQGILSAQDESQETNAINQMLNLWQESERKLNNLSDVLNLSPQDIEATMRGIYVSSETTRAIKVGKQLIAEGRLTEALEYINQWEQGADKENMYFKEFTEAETANSSKQIRTELVQDIANYKAMMAGEVDLQKLQMQENEVATKNSLKDFTTPFPFLKEDIANLDFVLGSSNPPAKRDEIEKLYQKKLDIQTASRSVADGTASIHNYTEEDKKHIVNVLNSQILQQPLFAGLQYDESVLDLLATGVSEEYANLLQADRMNPNMMRSTDSDRAMISKHALAHTVLETQFRIGYLDDVTKNYLRNGIESNDFGKMRNGLAIYKMMTDNNVFMQNELGDYASVYNKLARYPLPLASAEDEKLQEWLNGGNEAFDKHVISLDKHISDNNGAILSLNYLENSDALENALSRASLYGYTVQSGLRWMFGEYFPEADENKLTELLKDDATWIPFISKLYNGMHPEAHEAVMEYAKKQYPLEATGDGSKFDEAAWNQALEYGMHQVLNEGYGMTRFNGNGFITNEEKDYSWISGLFDIPFVDLVGPDGIEFFGLGTPNMSFVKYPLENMYDVPDDELMLRIKNDYGNMYDQVKAEAERTNNPNLIGQTFGILSDSGVALSKEEFLGTLDVAIKNNQIQFNYIEGTNNVVDVNGKILPAYEVVIRTETQDPLFGKGTIGKTITLKDMDNLDNNWRPINSEQIKTGQSSYLDASGNAINYANIKAKAAYNAVEQFETMFPDQDVRMIKSLIGWMAKTELSLNNFMGTFEFENVVGMPGTFTSDDVYDLFGDKIPFFQNKTFKELYQAEIDKLNTEKK